MRKKKKKKIKRFNQKVIPINLLNLLKKQLFKKEYYFIAGILIFAFVLRLIHLFQMQSNDPNFHSPHIGLDMGMYDKSAMNILNGIPIKGPFFNNPLYHYFLALNYYLFGHNLFTIRLIQALLGIITGLITYFIAKKIFNEKVAIISLLLYALCGYLIYYEGVLLSISLTTFLCVTSVWFFLQARDRKSNKRFITGGILLGLAALSQPNTLLLLPFVLLWILFELREEPIKRRLQRCTIVLLACFVAIFPITIKNYIDSGRFVLISTSGPFNFWIGNHENSLGWYDIYGKDLDRVNKVKKMGKKGDEVYIEDVINFIKTNPIGYLKLFIKKILLFWGEWDIPHQADYTEGKLYSPLLRLPIMLDFGLLAVLGLSGIFLSLNKRWWRKRLLLYLFIFVYSFSVVIIMVNGRYRPPIVPFLTIFAGFLSIYLYEKFKKRSYMSLFFSLCILILLILFVNSQLVFAKITCITNPNGIYIETENTLTIRDNSDAPHWGKIVSLNLPIMKIKKEFILNRDISLFKEVELFFYYSFQGDGYFIFSVNGVDSPPLTLGKDEFLHKMGFTFPAILLKKGLNTITFKTTGRANLSIPIDKYYDYGRSHISYDGVKWKKIKKEYLIQLKLIKTTKTKGK
ncbi:MAG: glycosyltransferase family 39 protein [bacterium]